MVAVGLIAALFLWNAGQLAGLECRPLLRRWSRRAFSNLSSHTPVGLFLIGAAPGPGPLELPRAIRPSRREPATLLSGVFSVPLVPRRGWWARLAGRLNVDPLQALGGFAKMLAAWLVAALAVAVAINAWLVRRRSESDAGLGGFMPGLLGLEGALALRFRLGLPFAPAPASRAGRLRGGLPDADRRGPGRTRRLVDFSLQPARPARAAECRLFRGGHIWAPHLHQFHAAFKRPSGSSPNSSRRP